MPDWFDNAAAPALWAAQRPRRLGKTGKYPLAKILLKCAAAKQRLQLDGHPSHFWHEGGALRSWTLSGRRKTAGVRKWVVVRRLISVCRAVCTMPAVVLAYLWHTFVHCVSACWWLAALSLHLSSLLSLLLCAAFSPSLFCRCLAGRAVTGLGWRWPPG